MLGECFDRSSKGAMAMVAYRYPRILEDRYTAFRQILPELPETYGKWEADVEGKKAMDRLAHVAAGGSFESHYVLVTSGAFTSYCQERHELRTLAMLYRFANENRG
jgi:hypothetical protein